MTTATYTENFNAFEGLGFAPNPTTGQLDSDLWIVTGFSDGSFNYGDTAISGDFARGKSAGGVTTGGIYGFEIATGNSSFGIQPSGDDFTPGTITLKLQNTTDTPVNEVTLEYLIRYRNDQFRANSLNFSYSIDGTNFTDVSSLNFTTPEIVDNLGWQSVPRSLTLSSLNIAPDDDFYVRWIGNDVIGSGSRDEYAIDDINITGLSAPGTTLPPIVTVAKINEIQGAGLQSPLLNQVVTIEAIVVGDFQGTNGLRGFYLQEEDTDVDGNDTTSEGIFIFDGSSPITDVSVGDKVRVTGTVTEFGSTGATLTELTSITGLMLLSSNNTLPTAVTIDSLRTANSQPLVLESYEGMRVEIAETLYLTEYFELGRRGSVVLSSEGRLQQPTNVTTPGDAANALQADNNLRRIILDDGRETSFPNPILFGRNGEPLSATNLLRGGDTVDDLAGIFDQRFGQYRVQTNAGVNFQGVNERPTTPPDVGGTLKIASYNVLNYFTTIDDGVNDARGADSAVEFQRQQDKLVSALAEIDADIFGLIEIENNGDVAVANLVDALNAVVGAGTYSYIGTGTIGTDAIKVALVYKSAKVTPLGDYQLLDSSDDPRFEDTRNRPILVQTFQEIATGERLTVAVNHLKSKSASGLTDTTDPNFDRGDGQGFWNATRTAAAEALVDWLATDPTMSGDADFLIIGDLNAYAMEDPIDAIESAGYTNLVKQFNGDDAYSYVFDGQAGYLDYALSSSSLTAQITGVADWHINADEPNVFDFNDNVIDAGESSSNPPLNLPGLYQVNPYRTSDHDPVIIGLDLNTPTPENFKLQLFHFSDQEAGIPALEDALRFSAVLNALRLQDLDEDGNPGFANTLTLSSGDAYLPGLFFGASQTVFGGVGRGDILIQNELGVQAISFGNHEFDANTGVVRNLILPSSDGTYPGTNFPYLSSNLDFSTDPNLDDLVTADGQEASTIPNKIAKSTVITLPGGEKIGVVGATTPILQSISSPGTVGVLPTPFDNNPTDAQIQALASIIQQSVDALLAENPGLNKVILLAHMQQIDIEQRLAGYLRNVDIIVAGGSNTRLFDSNDRPRAGDSAQGVYPIVKTDAEGNPIAIVNTDGNYTYVGRLVIDFDANGNIIPSSYDPNISGAYATDSQGVTDVNGVGLEDPEIVDITNQIREVINEQEGNFFGITKVYLNGRRAGGGLDGVRNQETNLGNLTADANLAIAQTYDPNVVISIKNAGGVRNSIGEIIVPTGDITVRVPPEEVPGVKPEGGISEAAIKNALSFNNGLSLVTVTAEELKDILEHGVAASNLTDPTNSPGQFPQVGGLSFSFDLDDVPGSRVQSLAIKDSNGTVTDVIVQNGQLIGDPNRTFRLVTLDFLASGGDGYPILGRDRINLKELDTDPRMGVAQFTVDGSEQDALAEYLAANFLDKPFLQEDTPREFDTRIQNLDFRDDTTLLSTRVGTPIRDNLVGTDGDDILVGFQGRDILTGGGGGDKFVYISLADRTDRIKDFSVGDDQIVLTRLLDSLGYSGMNAIADGYIKFRSSGSNTILQIDSDGSGSASLLSLALIENIAIAQLNNLANFIF